MLVSWRLGLGRVRWGIRRNLNSLLSDAAAEELTQSCANSFKLCAVSCTQRVSHDLLSSLSRLAKSRAGPLQRREMKVVSMWSWPKTSQALAQKLLLPKDFGVLCYPCRAAQPETLQCADTCSSGGESVGPAARPCAAQILPAATAGRGARASAQPCSTGHRSGSMPGAFPSSACSWAGLASPVPSLHPLRNAGSLLLGRFPCEAPHPALRLDKLWNMCELFRIAE